MMLGKYFKKSLFRSEYSAVGLVPASPQVIL